MKIKVKPIKNITAKYINDSIEDCSLCEVFAIVSDEWCHKNCDHLVDTFFKITDCSEEIEVEVE